MDTSNVRIDLVKGEYYLDLGNMRVPFVPLANNKKFPPLKPQKDAV